MREILFRGKRVDNGEWVFGGFYKGVMPETNNPFSIDNAKIKTIIISDGTYYHVEPETVGQYTGIKDRNGTLIFEGDILKSEVSGLTFIVLYNSNKASFITTRRTIKLSPENWGDKCQIIGNIHENPELLKQEEVCTQE